MKIRNLTLNLKFLLFVCFLFFLRTNVFGQHNPQNIPLSSGTLTKTSNGMFKGLGDERYDNKGNQLNISNPVAKGISENRKENSGIMEVLPLSVLSKRADATEGSLAARGEKLRWYRFSESDKINGNFRGKVYNNFGVWATNENLYEYGVTNKVMDKTYDFVNKNMSMGLGYNVTKKYIYQHIQGTRDVVWSGNEKADRTYDGYFFIGDIGPDKSYKITLLYEFGKNEDGNTKVRDWRTFTGTTKKLNAVTNVTIDGDNKIQWKKGTNYRDSFIKYIIKRKITGSSNPEVEVATITSGSDKLEWKDSEYANSTGDFSYFIYTVLSDGAPEDWNKSIDAGVRPQEFKVKYRNTQLKASQNLNSRVKLEWQSFRNLDYLDEIRIFRDFEEIARVSKSTTYYTDNECIPGKSHNYYLEFYGSNGDKIDDLGGEEYLTIGKSLPNGRISGYVKTANGTPVAGVKITVKSINELADGKGNSIQVGDSTKTDNSGYYEVFSLFYTDSATFSITASVDNSVDTDRFENAQLFRRLDIQDYNLKNVDFKDVGSYVVSGYVYFPNVGGSGANLPVEGAALYLNGTNSGVVSDSTGYYQIPISTVGHHKLKMVFDKHTIFSEGTDKVERSIYVFKDSSEINFEDKTIRDLYINVNAYNNAPVGDWITVMVNSKRSLLKNVGIPRPFSQTYSVVTHEEAPQNIQEVANQYRVREEYGRMKVSLPPTDFIVTVDSVMGVINVGSTAIGLEAPIRELKSLIFNVDLDIIDSLEKRPLPKEIDFVYYDNIKIVVNNKVDPANNLFSNQIYPILKDENGDFGGNYQILGENEKEEIKIQLLHQYSYRNKKYDAYLNTGLLKITDGVSDRDKDTINMLINPEKLALSLDSCFVNYTIVGGKPYMEKPYDKNLTILAYLNGEQKQVSMTSPFIVVGEMSRIGTFYTKTPEIPTIVLHDPPGDNSFATIAKGKSISTITEFEKTSGGNAGVSTDTKIGIGAWTPATGELGGGVRFSMEQVAGRDNTNGSAVATKYEFSEEFSTSADEEYIGHGGDIFIGNSKNLTYALADVLAYDKKNQKLIKTLGTSLDSVGFNTTFIYTERHIQETLYAQIETLIKQAAVDSLGAYNLFDNKRKELISINPTHTELQRMNDKDYKNLYETYQNKKLDYFYHSNNLKSWKDVIANNAKNREKAAPYANADYLKNISFSTGTSYNNSVTTESMKAESHSYDVSWAMSGAVGAYLIVGEAAESDILATMGASVTEHNSSETESEKSTTVSFHLEDDDPGDFFSVDILEDSVYKTPVFLLRAGTSSCPPEDGTQRRFMASLEPITGVNQIGVPADQPAKYQLKMANMSESDEPGYFNVQVIGNKNLNGARVLFGGKDITNNIATFYLEPASNGDKAEYIVPVELYKGVLNSEYNDVRILITPECEIDYRAYEDTETMDYVSLNATFQNSCSPVTLFRPGNNWIVNQSHNNKISYVIENFDASESSTLNYIIVQMRRLNSNGDWTTVINPIQKAELNGKSLYQQEFLVEHLADGDYEIRAVSFCTNGANYTPAQIGKINRTYASTFGVPSPANGILTTSDIVGVEFNKNIRNDFNNPIRYSLTNTKTGEQILAQVIANGKQLEIRTNPINKLDELENESLKVSVWNIIDDQSGNLLPDTISWNFIVNRSPLYWSPNSKQVDVIEGSAAKFSAQVKNKTAIAHKFTLTSYPTWLTPTVRNAEVSPQGVFNLDFGISNTLNTGTYVDTVKLTVEGREQFLYLTVNVLKDGPQWKVDPSKYKYSMNIVSQFSLDDTDVQLSEDNLDKIAVFINNEVRGVANVEYDFNLKKYYAFITAYTNTLSDQMTFRFWDARPGLEYVAKETNPFVNGAVLQSVDHPFILHPKEIVQTIVLEKGWNWVSLFTENKDMSLNNLLASMKPTEGDVIVTTVNNGKMSQFSASSKWVGNLEKLNINEGYKIYVNKADTIRIAGEILKKSTVLPLNEGWNTLGYPMPFNMEINSYLKNADYPSGTRIMSQDEFATFDATNKLWSGSLKYLRPNQGYRISISGSEHLFPFSSYANYQISGDKLQPNMQAESLTRPNVEVNGTLESNQSFQVTNFEGSSTTTFALNIGGVNVNNQNASNLVAKVKSDSPVKLASNGARASSSSDGSIVTSRYEVKAYVGDKLIGISNLKSLNDGEIRGFLSMSSASDLEGKEINFVVYDAVNKVNCTAKLVSPIINNDGNRSGTVASPVILMLEGLADIEVTTDLSEQTIHLNDILNYSYELKNIGQDVAVSLKTEEIIPSGLELLKATASNGLITIANGKWVYEAINLAKNASDKILIQVKPERVGVFNLGQIEVLTNNDSEIGNNKTELKQIKVIDERSNDANIFIPTLITPNGDGINDKFEIIGLGEFLTDVNVVIYDKNSSIIYSNSNYKNDWNGGNLTVGSYGYLIIGKDQNGAEVKYTGYVSIIR